jgi:AmmeMemoRadiSam system protein B
MMKHRKMHVAGTFYPDNCEVIERMIMEFDKRAGGKIALPFHPKALISPHAGYIYSGFTANAAYRLINVQGIKRVVVIGPSHRVYIKGASISYHDSYDTPCGEIEIDKHYAKSLTESYPFLKFSEALHAEHSTETQMPFVKHYFPDAKVIEIVYGEIDNHMLVPMIEKMLIDAETFVIISTDLSHFYGQKEANILDEICLKAVQALDYEATKKGCEACGLIGVKALLEAAQNRAYHAKVIDYRTSMDASGDASRVVGYMSALIG